MFDFRNQDVVGDFYTFNRNRYAAESAQATRLRGVGGVTAGDSDDDLDLAIASPARATSNANVHFHKVKKGDTLQAIARKCHTTVDKLCKLNHIGKSIRLKPGQILKYN